MEILSAGERFVCAFWFPLSGGFFVFCQDGILGREGRGEGLPDSA